MTSILEFAGAIDARLQRLLPEQPAGSFDTEGVMPWLLSDSMRYSLLAGGKRLRPAMLLAAVEMLAGNVDSALDIACAVEMIHTYSLIHDDLPGMDNDTMRRGRPTNHVVFGEGQAILAGDGLLNFAFERMLGCALRHRGSEAAYLKAIYEIASGAGVAGMIGGQVMDLHCEREQLADAEMLEYIQLSKTACMFIHPLRAAGWLAGADEAKIDALGRFGEAFGLLFQATDDLLDVVGSPEEVGKTLGKDARSGKLTCISMYGEGETRARIDKLHVQARQALAPFGDRAQILMKLTDSMVNRAM